MSRTPAGPAVTQLFPIVSTSDMEATLAFYRDLLGGTVAYEFPGPDGVVVYAGLDLGSSHIGIGFNPDLPESSSPRPVSLWVYVSDCDAAIEHLRRAGVTVTEEPADQTWGERVARVLDPNGNEVILGQHAGS